MQSLRYQYCEIGIHLCSSTRQLFHLTLARADDIDVPSASTKITPYTIVSTMTEMMMVSRMKNWRRSLMLAGHGPGEIYSRDNDPEHGHYPSGDDCSYRVTGSNEF